MQAAQSYPVGAASPLSLDFYTNNCHSESYNEKIQKNKEDEAYCKAPNGAGTHRAYCSAPVGVFTGVQYTTGGRLRGVRSAIRCKRWSCPYCADKNLRLLRYRLFNGGLSESAKRNGFRCRYNAKMLTLTYGGNEKRSSSTPEKAYEEMVEAFHKMLKALQKRLGKIYYVRVVEKHKNGGWPHFHVLLVGDGIARKEFLEDIENLWRNLYGMGFVWLKQIKNFTHAIRYITKYLTKDIEPVGFNKRVFTASKGALVPIQKRSWYLKDFKMGIVDKGLQYESTVSEEQLSQLLNIPDLVRENLSPKLYQNLIGDSEDKLAKEIFIQVIKGGKKDADT